MDLTIPQSLAAILPLIATMLSAWLAADRLPRLTNAAIALVALVVTGAICAWLAGNFTGNAQASVLFVLGYVAILMQGELRMLSAFLLVAPSPLAALAPSPPPPSPPPSPFVPRTSLVRGNTPRPPGIPGG